MAGEALEFPRFVYYVPGPVQAHGFTYDQIIVEDQAAYDDALTAGYFKDLLEAKDDFDSRGSDATEGAPKRRGRPAKNKGDQNAS